MTRSHFFVFCLMALFLSALPVHAEKKRIPNCLEDSVVGEWARYSMTGGLEMRLEVTEVVGRKITIATTTYVNGRELAAPTPTLVDLDFMDPTRLIGLPDRKGREGKKPVFGEETVVIDARELDCTTVQVGGFKVWYSKAVPVYGIVRIQRDGEISQELKEWDGGVVDEAGEPEVDPVLRRDLKRYMKRLELTGFEETIGKAWDRFDQALMAMDQKRKTDLIRHLRACERHLEEALEKGEEIHPGTDKVKELHERYMKATTLYEEGVALWAEGLDRQDGEKINRSAEKLTEADDEMVRFDVLFRKIDPAAYERWTGESAEEEKEEETTEDEKKEKD